MAPRAVRVVSLLPSATDTLYALEKTAGGGKLLPFELCGCSHECEVPGGDSLERVSGAVPPVRLTRSRIGDIPIDDIELAFNASVAAIQEFMTLCEVRYSLVYRRFCSFRGGYGGRGRNTEEHGRVRSMAIRSTRNIDYIFSLLFRSLLPFRSSNTACQRTSWTSTSCVGSSRM